MATKTSHERRRWLGGPVAAAVVLVGLATILHRLASSVLAELAR